MTDTLIDEEADVIPGQQLIEGGELPVDEAPKRPKGRPRGRKDSAPRAPRVRPPAAPSRKKQLEELVGMAGTSLSAYGAVRGNVRVQIDGQIVLSGGAAWADAMDQLCKKNESVARVVDSMLTGTTYTAVIVSTLAILIPILANHELLPAAVVGMAGGMMEGAPVDDGADPAASAAAAAA